MPQKQPFSPIIFQIDFGKTASFL